MARLAVDEVVEVVGRPLQQLVGLRLRDRAGLDGRVELRLGVGRQRLLEAVDRLALRLGDLGEASSPTSSWVRSSASVRPRYFAAASSEARRRDGRSRTGDDDAPAAEERDATALGRAGLHRVALRLGDLAGRDRGIDAVVVRALEGGLERRRGDVQPLGDVVQERVLIVADRVRGGHAGSDRQNRHQGTDRQNLLHPDRHVCISSSQKFTAKYSSPS